VSEIIVTSSRPAVLDNRAPFDHIFEKLIEILKVAVMDRDGPRARKLHTPALLGTP